MASLRTTRLAEAVDISSAKYGIILGVCEARFPFAVKGRVGKAMTEAVAKALQARMFECGDGVWLFPQMVMDDAA